MQNASASPSLIDRMAQGAGRAREAFASRYLKTPSVATTCR